MAPAQAKQERLAVMFMSGASALLAVFAYLGQPAPGEFVEAEPDAYVLFQKILHGAILLLLVLALTRLGKMTEERPGLRVPLLVMMLVGIAGAAFVVALDFNLV
jgi:hypothetical protein